VYRFSVFKAEIKFSIVKTNVIEIKIFKELLNLTSLYLEAMCPNSQAPIAKRSHIFGELNGS
jgi:hypothetical protein